MAWSGAGFRTPFPAPLTLPGLAAGVLLLAYNGLDTLRAGADAGVNYFGTERKQCPHGATAGPPRRTGAVGCTAAMATEDVTGGMTGKPRNALKEPASGEPVESAAVFGAVALGYALWHRRARGRITRGSQDDDPGAGFWQPRPL